MASSCGLAKHVSPPQKRKDEEDGKNLVEDTKGDDKSTTAVAQGRSADDEYRTPYPIAWYGAGGWRREIENTRGGETALGVSLTEESLKQDGGDATDQRRRYEGPLEKWIRKAQRGVRRETASLSLLPSSSSSLKLAVLAVLALTLLCGVLELMPAEAVRFVAAGGLFLRPVVSLTEMYEPARRGFLSADKLFRTWDRVMVTYRGWAAVHMVLGIVTVWVVAALRLNRARAYLTIGVACVWSSYAVADLIAKYRLVSKFAEILRRAKNAVRSEATPAWLRPLAAYVPPPAATARLLRATLVFVAALLVPLLYWMLSVKFPLAWRWLGDGVSTSRVLNTVLAAIALAAVFSWIHNLDDASATNDDTRRRNALAGHFVHALLTTFAMYLVMTCVYPEFSGSDARAMMSAHLAKKRVETSV